MRTMEERERLIHQRTAQLKKEKYKKQQRITGGLGVVVCLVLIICTAVWMPEQMSTVIAVSAPDRVGVASILGNHSCLGYILIGIFSFLLGMSVTILLYRLRDRMESHREDTDEF